MDVRPSYFSKLLCFYSLHDSIVNSMHKIDLINIHDGNNDTPVQQAMRNYDYTIKRVHCNSGAKSFLAAMEFVTDTFTDENDIIYFCEGDYLHRSDAITKMFEVFEHQNPDYVTLYDHPDRYTRDDNDDSDLEVLLTPSHHWRTVESNTFTFATTLKVLREDSDTLQYYSQSAYTKSRFTFYDLRGKLHRFPYKKALLKYFIFVGKRLRMSWIFNSRKIFAPIPSLSTHMELDYLAPTVEWSEIAEELAEKYGLKQDD